jgi:hypothetical protein
MDAFYGLYGLLYLDLSHNLLESLPPGLFDQQFSLRELLLHNNKLNRLPPGFLSNIPAKMVRLDGNPWHCTCAMRDWQPAVINKIKQKRQLNFCQFHYDKGSMCNRTQAADHYVYDKRVAPQCTTPSKFKNWSVFQVLWKELRCNRKQHVKMDRKAYLKKKYEDYEQSIKPTYMGNRSLYTYYPHNAIKPNVNKKSVAIQNSPGNANLQQNSTKTQIREVPTMETFNKLTKATPSSSADIATELRNNKQTLKDKSSELEFKEDGDTTSVMQMPSVNTLITPTPQSTNEHNYDLILDNGTYIHLSDVTTSKYDANIANQAYSTAVTTSTRTVIDNKDMNPTSKKEKQKMELLREMKEKSAAKQKLKQTEGQYFLHEENGKQMKLSKKAWKLEQERKRQEKLKRFRV